MSSIILHPLPPLTQKDIEEIAFAFAPHIPNPVTVTLKIEEGQVLAKSDTLLSRRRITQDMAHSAKQALYDILSQHSRHTLPYGIMTGVKPVRKVLRLLTEGKSEEECRDVLKKDFLVSEEKAALLLQTAKNAPAPLCARDILVYIQIPFCPSRCSYCSFRSEVAAQGDEAFEPYLRALAQEIVLVRGFLEDNRFLVRAFYIGGGTPAMLSAEQADKLLELLQTMPHVADAEMTFEAGRAELLQDELLRVLKQHNVTRLCINAQSLHDATLENIGRSSTVKDFYRAYARAQHYDFAVLNCDLIAGIDENAAKFLDSVQGVMQMGFSNITLHTLAIKNHALMQRSLLRQRAYAAQALAEAHALLKAQKYLPYYLYRQKFAGDGENTGFALADTRCLYNAHMINNTAHVIGLGTGASSALFDTNCKRHKFFNYCLTREYIAHIRERTTEKLDGMQAILNAQKISS